MPGYGESIRSLGLDYAGEAQPSDPDRGDPNAKFVAAADLMSERPSGRPVRRCTA